MWVEWFKVFPEMGPHTIASIGPELEKSGGARWQGNQWWIKVGAEI
jgi:hypothetical protein